MKLVARHVEDGDIFMWYDSDGKHEVALQALQLSDMEVIGRERHCKGMKALGMSWVIPRMLARQPFAVPRRSGRIFARKS